ncbi:ion transporter [Halobacillus litoralis]|uniref:Ion transporter n=1 Tax=Halobacillus litoralis TaxID=45668 RepID=A0A845FBW7_9BACI|nr:ion transporter [Halobacillus sp. HZG1]MEC3885617.1 ion transporter [Halobacillus sp. HZG1]MYL71430.1 ion transporter [Halobacillus litoralis]
MKLRHFIEHKSFSRFILTVILINAVIIGISTDDSIYQNYQSLFIFLDILVLSIFTVEIILKLVVYRRHFFKDGWNIFDFVIVFGSLVLYNTHFVGVLRILRVLRVLRTISVVPSLRRLTSALFLAIPAIGSVMILMAIIFYVYAIIGVTFFGDIAPEYFGNVGLSTLTLFQVFTLESWASGVFRPIFAEITWSWVYFVSFIVISAFIILNLIIGEIVNNAQQLSEHAEEESKDMAKIMNDLDELKQMIREQDHKNNKTG